MSYFQSKHFQWSWSIIKKLKDFIQRSNERIQFYITLFPEGFKNGFRKY